MIDLWTRGADGNWAVRHAGAGEVVEIASWGLRLEVDRILRDALDPSGS